MSDPQPDGTPKKASWFSRPPGSKDSDVTDAADKPAFTKEPQPDLPLPLRQEKAGLTRNRIAIWIVIGGVALFLIGEGVVGILTKAR